MVKTALGDAVCALDGMEKRNGRVQRINPKNHIDFDFIIHSNISLAVARVCPAMTEELREHGKLVDPGRRREVTEWSARICAQLNSPN
jgi:hypothetical protein